MEEEKDKKGFTGRNFGSKTIPILGELESRTKEGITVATGTIYDYAKEKFQQTINEEYGQQIESLNNSFSEVVQDDIIPRLAEAEEKVDNNIPYIIVYENQYVNIPCDAYGNCLDDSSNIETKVKLYHGNIVENLAETNGIIVDSQGSEYQYILDEQSGDNSFASLSILGSNVKFLQDLTEVDFHLVGESETIVYGKIFFNKVKKGKSAYEEWKDANPSIENPTINRFLAELKNTDSINGPKYAPDIASATEDLTIYFIPNSDPTKFDIYLREDENNINLLAEGIQGDITNYAGIYDVSADHSNTQYATLSAALAVIPTTAQKPGMTIKYIDSESGKYVQYRLTKSTFSTDVADWERVSLDDIRASITSILGGESDVDVEVVHGGDNIVADNNTTNLQKKTVGQTLPTSAAPNYSITGYRGYKIKVSVGEKYRIQGLGNGNEYNGMYSLTDNDGIVLQYNFSETDSRNNPIPIAITQNGWLYVNLKSYSAAEGDGVFKVEKQQVTGLLDEKVSDAPDDGKEYIRKDNNWIEAGTEQARKDLNGYDETTSTALSGTPNQWIQFNNKQVGDTIQELYVAGSALSGSKCYKINVQAGDSITIIGKGANTYVGFYILAVPIDGTTNYEIVGCSYATVQTTKNLDIASDGILYVNLYNFNSETDGVFKNGTQHVKGIKERVSDIEESMSDDEDTPVEAFDRQINGYDEEVYKPFEPRLNKWVQTAKKLDNDIIQKEGVIYEASNSLNGNAAYFVDVKAGDEIKIKGKDTGSDSAGFYVLLADYSDTKYIVISHLYGSSYHQSHEVTLSITQDGKLAANLSAYNPSDGEGVFKKVTQHVNGIGDTTTALDNARKIEVCIPDVIHAVRGDTLQLFYHSIFRCVDYSHYDINVRCDIGAQFPKYYEVTPNENTTLGNHDITFTIKDNNNNVLGTKKVKIKVVNTPVSPSENINILCVGASGTEQGQWASEFKRRLVGTDTIDDIQGNGLQNITFVGRMDVTYNNKQVNLEATGGFDFSSYIAKATQRTRFKFSGATPTISVGDVYTNSGFDFTVVELNLSAGYFSCDMTGNASASGTLTRKTGSGSLTINYTEARRLGNPFYDENSDEINLSEYIDEYCNGSVDVVFTELHGNGSYAYSTNFTTRFNNMQAFIDMFLDVNPDCKFCIGLQWTSCVRGGTGIDYKAAGGFSYEYGMRYTWLNLCNALQKYIDDNNLSDKVFIVNWLNEFDSVNNMQKAYPAKRVNTRNSTTETFGRNGNHPAEEGYNQMADAAYRLFVGEFCQ